jgi:hypothetical protein
MIISEVVNVKISNNQIAYFRNLGYDVKGGNEIKEIKVSDLSDNSAIKIIVECDICGKRKETRLRNYNLNTNKSKKDYACCRKCANEKNKNTTIIKYGVENISQLKHIKEQKVRTSLINNNVEYPQQSEAIYQKSLATKKLKYNDENYNNTTKRKITCLLKYGFEHAMLNSNISDKLKLKMSEILKHRIENSDKYLKLKIKNFNNSVYTFNCDCNKDHTFDIDYKLLWQRIDSKSLLCTICNPIDRHTSGKEIQLLNFIKENYSGKIIENDRMILEGKELDIYLPELRLAFEFNGLYWHSDINKSNNYHISKTNKCLEKGIKLIHIWEHNWDFKQDIIKSLILYNLNKFETEFFAKNCKIINISDVEIIKKFLNDNHIQGYEKTTINIGLYHNNELVSLICFNKKDSNYEILRICNKLNYNIIDAELKLLKYFIKKYKFVEIIVYVDRCYSQGELYSALKFNLISISQPNYHTINNTENISEDRTYKIYDSGVLKFNYLS